MKLQEKHIIFLDSLPLNKWVYEHNMGMGDGITRGTIKAFADMGIIDLAIVPYPETLTDVDIEEGFIKLPVQKYRKNGEIKFGFLFGKKLLSDYRTRDYELDAMRLKLKQLEAQIYKMENK